MTKTVGGTIVCLCLFLTSILTFGQTLQSVVGVSGNGQNLCQDIQNSTSKVTATCQGSWNDGSGNFGSGSGTVTTDYGLVRSSGTASVTTASGSPFQTVVQIGGSFSDSMTFPSLTSAAFLKATLTVTGWTSGDPASYVSSSVSMTIFGVTGNQCLVLSLKGSCTASVPVSPGDSVAISGTFDNYPIANVNATGSSSATLNYDGKQKNNGASFAFVLVDSSGHTIRGVPIVTASGATYPTR
jgi:hypothetical protein